jgi:predicted AlkP superfamily pyrophosphatase or phosphodiesterase
MRFLLILVSMVLPAQRVIVVGVDGLSVRGVMEGPAPNLKRMIAEGAWTVAMRGVMPTVSSPNWASMIMGAGPEQHGITSNDWERDKFTIEPVCKAAGGMFPSLFDVVKGDVGVFHEWQGLGRLVAERAGVTVEHRLTGEAAMAGGLKFWRERKPVLLFVHLDLVDHAGHQHGWHTAEYFEAVGKADALIGEAMKAAEGAVVIVGSDHGGVEKKHGGESMAELLVPWLAWGGRVKRGELKGPANQYDMAPTVMALLGQKGHECWVGKVLGVR